MFGVDCTVDSQDPVQVIDLVLQKLGKCAGCVQTLFRPILILICNRNRVMALDLHKQRGKRKAIIPECEGSSAAPRDGWVDDWPLNVGVEIQDLFGHSDLRSCNPSTEAVSLPKISQRLSQVLDVLPCLLCAEFPDGCATFAQDRIAEECNFLYWHKEILKVAPIYRNRSGHAILAYGSKTRYFFSNENLLCMERFLRSAVVVLVLLLVQTTFIPYLSILGYAPDILLPWLVYVALRRGQLEATLYGFGVGFLQDMTATQFLGLAALSKTISCFVIGYFFNENTAIQTLGSYRYVLIVMLCSFIHDAIYYAIFFLGVEGSLVIHTLQFSIASSIYTGVVTLLPMFAFSQKYSTSMA